MSSVIKTVNIANIDGTVVEERLRGFLSRCGAIKKMVFTTTPVRKAAIGMCPRLPHEEGRRMFSIWVCSADIAVHARHRQCTLS